MPLNIIALNVLCTWDYNKWMNGQPYCRGNFVSICGLLFTRTLADPLHFNGSWESSNSSPPPMLCPHRQLLATVKECRDEFLMGANMYSPSRWHFGICCIILYLHTGISSLNGHRLNAFNSTLASRHPQKKLHPLLHLPAFVHKKNQGDTATQPPTSHSHQRVTREFGFRQLVVRWTTYRWGCGEEMQWVHCLSQLPNI